MKIVLTGCQPEPISSYLKSLGIIRLIYEQKDRNVKGYWENDIFVLESEALKGDTYEEANEALIDFFLNEYCPTPIVSPWNKRSGFKYGEPGQIDNILKSTDTRLNDYRSVIEKVKEFEYFNLEQASFKWIFNQDKQNLSKDKQDGTKKFKDIVEKYNKTEDNLVSEIMKVCSKEDRRELENIIKVISKEIIMNHKAEIISLCRNVLPDSVVKWIDAAIAVEPASGDILTADILGSGGNDGSMDFSSNFMKNILKISNPSSKELLSNALFGVPTSKLTDIKIGMYDPGKSGGTNQRNSEKNQENFLYNFWNYILLMEGTIIWSGSVGKRYIADKNQFQSPFTVNFSSAGITSINDGENSDDVKKYRKEIWTPIWNRPFSYVEIEEMFREGRVTVRKSSVKNGLQFTEAVKSMGVDRGISLFIRYANLARKGKSSILIPQDYIRVEDKSEDLKASKDIYNIVSSINQIISKSDSTQSSLRVVKQDIESALYSYFIDTESTESAQNIIKALGRSVRVVTRLNKSGIKNPFSGLSPSFVKKANDNSIEFKLALALSEIPFLRGSILNTNIETGKLLKEKKESNWWSESMLTGKISKCFYDMLLEFDKSKNNSNPMLDLGHVMFNLKEMNMLLENRISDRAGNFRKLDERKVEELFLGLLSLDKFYHGPLNYLETAEKVYNNTNINLQWQMLKLLFITEKIYVENKEITLFPKKNLLTYLMAGRIRDACSIAYTSIYSKGLSPYSSIIVEHMDIEKVKRYCAYLILKTDPKDLLKNVIKGVKA